ncbi:P-loop containing nucleoside triphosphate hydrolase superfamily protein [Zea mays]|nr:P-loop containing nucleoside triphosphate hydrolase superfamily protein [Zea mays]
MKSEALSTIRKKTVANSIRPALHSSKDSSKCNSSTLEMQSNSASIVNDNDSISAKKHSSRAANFFDRFRKERPVDAKTHSDVGLQRATLQRDSRPLIFKYNEVFFLSIALPKHLL